MHIISGEKLLLSSTVIVSYDTIHKMARVQLAVTPTDV